jgi:autotransporter-associated beta strand protein
LTSTTGTVGSLNANGTSSFKIYNNTSGANDSTLTLGGAGNLGNSFSSNSTDLIYVSSGAELTIQGPTAGTAFLKVTLGQNGTFNIAGTSTISSAISGTNLGFTKTGAGALTLNGTNAYTGSTTVSAGKLILGSAGSIASSSVLKIASGATFDVKAKSAGFTLNTPLTIDVDVANAGKLDATGVALTYGGNLTLNITTATPLSSYNLFVFSSELGTFSSIALTGSFSGNMTNSSGVWTASSNGYDFTFTESNGVLSAATAAIPEPGTWVLVGIAAIFFLYRMRRKDASSSGHN